MHVYEDSHNEKYSQNPSRPPENEGQHSHKFQKGWQWYDPPQDVSFASYCSSTSLHGIQYIAQEERHMFERIFWLLSCLAATIYGTVFIYKMWHEYIDMPVITVFNPTEKTLEEIPFPAVTICNVNNIRMSKLNEYIQQAHEAATTTSKIITETSSIPQILASIMDVEYICESKETFSERFTPNVPRFRQIDQDILTKLGGFKQSAEKLVNPTLTLRKGSQLCSEMILFCLWMEEKRNCSQLFQEIETDFGSCCVFNMIPAGLLLKYTGNPREDLNRIKRWNSSGPLDYDNILFEKDNDDRIYPRRQLYPGRGAGLSFLVDPDLDEYDCTNTDSEGFMVSVNVPLDFPKMRDNNGIAIPTNAEVFIGVRPEVTMSEEAIKQYPLDKRRCYFSSEYELTHYTKYSFNNCMTECIAAKTYQKCKCKKHFMPRGKNESLCNSHQNPCTENVRKRVIQMGTDKECSHCLPTCVDIDYHTETTYLKIRKKAVANLHQQFSEYPSFRNATIVHVYFNVDAVYPRLRKEMTTAIDLISNAGGLLGFCMGFSILSVLEVIWFVTFRLFFKLYRKRLLQPKKERPVRNGFKSGWRNFYSNYNFLIVGIILMICIIIGAIYLKNWISAKMPSS